MKKLLYVFCTVGLITIAVVLTLTFTSRPTTTTNATNTSTNTNAVVNTPTGRPNGGLAVRPNKDDLIIVNNLTANAVVESPLTIEGEARGSWYFEAVFPVALYDADGNVIASGQAQAQSDWMTSDYVPFTVTLTFSKPTTETGVLKLMKDNPSGDPARDNALDIPVRFVASGEVINQ